MPTREWCQQGRRAREATLAARRQPAKGQTGRAEGQQQRGRLVVAALQSLQAMRAMQCHAAWSGWLQPGNGATRRAAPWPFRPVLVAFSAACLPLWPISRATRAKACSPMLYPNRTKYRLVVATRQCWSERRESCGDSMKFGLSSSGCESRPAKAEPGRPVASLAAEPAMARLMRRQANKWAAAMQPRNGSFREAQGVTNPEGSRRRHRYKGEGASPQAGWTTAARLKRTAQ
jgi:hypothetical protein